jgi:hypothetical protein
MKFPINQFVGNFYSVDQALKVEEMIWLPSKVAKGDLANSQRTLLHITLFFVFFFKKNLGLI